MNLQIYNETLKGRQYSSFLFVPFQSYNFFLLQLFSPVTDFMFVNNLYSVPSFKTYLSFTNPTLWKVWLYFSQKYYTHPANSMVRPGDSISIQHQQYDCIIFRLSYYTVPCACISFSLQLCQLMVVMICHLFGFLCRDHYFNPSFLTEL